MEEQRFLSQHHQQYQFNEAETLTFPIARSALSKKRIIPKKRKNTPKPVNPIPISAGHTHTTERLNHSIRSLSLISYEKMQSWTPLAELWLDTTECHPTCSCVYLTVSLWNTHWNHPESEICIVRGRLFHWHKWVYSKKTSGDDSLLCSCFSRSFPHLFFISLFDKYRVLPCIS